MRRKKKKEGSCYIVRCQRDAKHWIAHPRYRPQHVCDDCKEYMVVQLKWHTPTAAAQAMFERLPK